MCNTICQNVKGKEGKVKPFIIKPIDQPKGLTKFFNPNPKSLFPVELNNYLARTNETDISQDNVVAIAKGHKINDIYKSFNKEINKLLKEYALALFTKNEFVDSVKARFFRLSNVLVVPQSESNKLLSDLRTEIFQQKMAYYLGERRSVDEEAEKYINDQVAALGVSDETASALVDKIRSGIIQAEFTKIISDERVSPAELEAINSLALSMKTSYQLSPETKKQLDHFVELWHLENDPLEVVEPDILIPKGEKCYFMGAANYYEMRKVTTGVTYGGPGVRLKIAKGIYYRAGSYKGARETQDQLVKIDSGMIYVTSKKIQFVGPLGNKVIRYNQIIDLNPFSDSVQIIKETGKSPYIEVEKHLVPKLTTVIIRVLADNL